MSSMNARWWANLAVGFLMVIVSSALALLLAELALRVFGIGSDQFLRPDPILGVRFIPAKTGLNQNACYRSGVSINTHGWRGREMSLTKPEGVYRVLVLGDSFMAGLQVENEDTFASVLEDRLNRQQLPHRVEVMNFSVPSWGTGQEYLSLREYGLSFEPDLIVLAFYAQNDVSDNSSVLRAKGSTYPQPSFDIKGGGLVELPYFDPTPAPIAIGRRLAAPFRLYPLVRNSLLGIPLAHRLLYKLGVVGVVPREEAGRQTSVPWLWPERWKHQLGVYMRDYPLDWIHAWAITEGLLAKIQDEAKKASAEFLLVQIADPVAVMPQSLRFGLVADGTEEVLDVDKPTRLLGQLAQKNNIDFMSIIPSFRDRIANSVAEFEKYYLSCDGHWTPAGHRLAAELVAPRIATRIVK